MAKLTKNYVKAGAEYRVKLIDQAVELMGYHRKAAIRALNRKPKLEVSPLRLKTGRPREYCSGTLLPPLKAIWFAANQPCGCRLKAMLPEWVPAYEADHCRLDRDVRRALLSVSARSLDRLLAPLRASHSRRGATRPGSMLRQSIPIRGTWDEEGPGWVEMDTVAMCGGTLDDRHIWMLDVVDIWTSWVELRALANRGQHSTLEQVREIEKSLPFAMHQHGSSHVPAHQPMFRQVAGQCHTIEFVDRFHFFGRGCAVTKRGISVPLSINHAQRIFKRVPSGAVSGPSTT